ncbi:Magnesium transport protein CorA [Methyloligella halotolerans]|uniref:Magnesium transport protein CorA n=1 Tax=Methyloligella halotolerans TaxID=1177755 RepID=A0A1E2RZV4_9HYPH|nr:magnesium transporter CorA family protein [Methyloligella halotolerans]ODA67618.1 Magnesium transport protein CorA [Methyloligella halotolerans]
MLTIFETAEKGLATQEGSPALTDKVVWLDLNDPTAEETRWVEETLNVDVPTRAEQAEIEVSSRLYKQNGTDVMTATIMYQVFQPQPAVTTVTFMLAEDRLITLRYANPRAFEMCVDRARYENAPPSSGIVVLLLLLEAIIDRTADAIERIQGDVDALSHTIFEIRGRAVTKQRRLDEVLRSVGQQGDLAWRAGDSVHSLGRLMTFFAYTANERKVDKLLKTRIRTASRDVSSLSDHVNFLTDKIVFLLDAVLGMITIEQNNITKIFSVAAVIFLPPTTIASIYGMNFEHMPELDWFFGYPFALCLMVLCALGSYIYWKRKGWL